MSLNLFSFVQDMNRHIVFTRGENTLAQAEANPPQPDTPEFAKTVNVLEVFITGKKDRQNRAIALLCDQPILATTQVVSSVVKMMGEEKDTSRRISLDQLGNLPAMIANGCKVAVYEDIDNPKPSPRQVGALHNLVNLVDILVTGYAKKRGCIREIADMAVARFEGNLPSHFTKRTEWAFDNRSAPVEQAPAKPSVANGKTNGHASPTPVANGTFGERLGAALGIKPESVTEQPTADASTAPAPEVLVVTPSPTLVVAEDADLATIMQAEMARLGGLSPEALDLAKVGADGGVVVQTTDETQELLHESVVEETAEEQIARIEEYLADVPEEPESTQEVGEPELVGAA